MKQNLFNAILIVFLVWFVIAYLASGLTFSLFPEVARGVLLIWIVGGCAGVSLAWIARRWMVSRTQHTIAGAGEPDPRIDASIKDGEDDDAAYFRVALPRIEPPDMKSSAGNPAHSQRWWSALAADHPGHAAVIDDVFAIMQTRPHLPAGIDGHQHVTLVEHSIDVVVKMLELAPTWKFEGIENTRGTIIAPVQSDSPHTFGAGTAVSEPLLVTAAFAHDVGKVECLVTEDGRATSILPHHGQRGAELLRRLPSVAALPMDERDALLIAVKYYHHLSNIPLADWIGDRPRSLAALLYQADSESSYNKRREGEEPDVSVTPQAAEDATPETEATAPAAAALSDEGTAPAQARTVPGYSTPNGATPLDVAIEILSEHGRVNATSTAKRVAWKYGDWVYVSIAKLVTDAARKLADSTVAAGDPAKSPFVATLLAELDAKGCLYRGEPPRAAADAVWETVSSSNGDTGSARKYWTVVLSTKTLPYLSAVEDCRYPPLLVGKDAGSLAKPPVQAVQGSGTDAGAEGQGDLDFDAAIDLMIGRSVNEREINKNARRTPAISEKCDTVALTRKETQQQIAKPMVTADMLVAMGRSEKPLYGMEQQVHEGMTVLFFDAGQLAQDYAFATNDPPRNTRIVTGKGDGRQKIAVVVP